MVTTKTCPTCKQEKDIELFIKPSLWNCKECSNRWTNEYRRKKREAYLLANPKPVRTAKECKLCREEKPFGEFYFANRQKGILSSYCKGCQIKFGNAQRATRADGRLREKCTRVRTTVEWYFAQLERQNHRCAICGDPETHPVKRGGKTRSLAIDHDHKTGRVRGLLCFRCNTSIHLVDKYGAEWLKSVADYLNKLS